MPLTLLLLAAAYFAPPHRVTAIGVAREPMDPELVEVRTEAMIQSQTFSIMREPHALAGAKRIIAPKLQSIFKSAGLRAGLPASLLESIAFLESWGDPKAESPAGPKGIMQISEATGRRIGLKVVRARRFKTTTEKVAVKRKGKTTYKNVTRKTPYTVTVRDDRLVPERAVPAAAMYLAAMERKFGGRDWAIFAYHCGEGCVAEMQALTRQARGIPEKPMTVAGMFFGSSPAWNRDLYEAIQRQMERDYSPTYWFRVRRAEQLLTLYRRDPAAFQELVAAYRSESYPGPRAPHRLSTWVRPDDLRRPGRLVTAPDDPERFNFTLRPGIDARTSPATLGALIYVAFETRRLFDALHPRGETFQPLEVTALLDTPGNSPEGLSHMSARVFDVAWVGLGAGERECLRFVLNDLGWANHLGFVEEGGAMHIGCAPQSRDFFTRVFDEATAPAE
jgi:hypothetical protein